MLGVMLLGSLSGLSQELPERLKLRNEVFFSFEISSREELAQLTNLISIDQVAGREVRAYANLEQFVKFSRKGYPVTLLPLPCDGPGITMKDHLMDGQLTTWNFYPTYSGYESLMVQFQTQYPGLCHLDTLATLASGRRLLVLKISDNVLQDETEPEFLYTSSIHGDETTGYIMMLQLADYLLSNYSSNAEAADIVNNLEIYICPLANPDGTFYGGNNTLTGARRYNIAGVDLNRNYPDPQDGQHPDGNSWQPETVAFMNFASQHHFVAGCNFHGGTEVVNYPWDTWSTLHADDNWFQYISREYADTVHLHAPAGYLDDLVNGITNGYAWYQVNGGRQDYMNYFHHCREITIEISGTKMPAASQLPLYWDYNHRSFLLLLKEAMYGIRGVITDQTTGNPVNAKVMITGHDNNGSEVYSYSTTGEYYRPVKAGTYTLEFSAPCYQTQTISGVAITDHASVVLNVQLITGSASTINTFPWSEGFENGGAIPSGWTQEQVNGSGVNWTFITGNGNTHPANAHSGIYNGSFKDVTTASNKTKLITPALNLTWLPSPQLKFWHTQALWSPDQDELSVYYKNTCAGIWTLLATFTSNVTAWTQETLSLPASSGNYYIAFEGNAKYGYGVCLDDIMVQSATTVPFNSSIQNPNVSGSLCYNASHTLTVAGNGSTFIVPAGGGATLVAGFNIVFLPGTVVTQEGYMHGYITENFQFCNQPSLPLNAENKEHTAYSDQKESNRIRIYPNPAEEQVFVDLTGFSATQPITLELIGSRGSRIEEAVTSGGQIIRISLRQRPAGMYFIRILSSGQQVVNKIIKMN